MRNVVCPELVRAFAAGLLSSILFSLNGQPLVFGRVVDVMNGPIPNAQVSVSDSGGTAGSPVVTRTGGEFALTLRPGAYRLRITAEGFQTAGESIQVPEAGLRLNDIVLRIEAFRTAVTVISEGSDYVTPATNSATRTLTPLRDVPQSITIVAREQMRDQMMTSIGDVVRYVPGVTYHQGENNRDQVIIRGNNSSADFFVNGVRDDVPYYRDLYNLERVEALKGPNAMIFGRGGAGGVINRVTKEPDFGPLREVSLQGGSFGNKRVATDFNQPLGGKVAVRLNGVFENSDSFRDYAHLERFGVSPSMTARLTGRTRLVLGYELFDDRRVADRGIPSWLGRPADIPIATFFGNPDESKVRARVNLGSATLEHQAGAVNFRNRTMVGNYDRYYQNFVPGAVTADRLQVPITSYNNATVRLNAFNQSDVTGIRYTGRFRHTLLGGAEFGRQLTDNLRNTGYFNNTATSFLAPLSNPAIAAPITFRPSATDANNRLETQVAATYVQDQIQLSRFAQVVAGLRVDRFDLRYHNNRNSENLRRLDNLISPRAGLVIKPVDRVSIYSSYSVSYLPSSGDQFSSLTTITQQVKPEKFNNYEAGVKWDAARGLSLTGAVYRLDRTNTRSTDPNDPTRIIQTGSQRTNGVEAGVAGSLTRSWRIAGGYAYQDAFVTSATAAARAGAQVGQVPHHQFSLWNNYQIMKRVGAGLGILNRSDMFAAIDNTVTLPSYTRADAAVFVSLTEKVRLQANVENLTNRRYYVNADGNTNISPGSPRSVRVGLIARF